MSRKAFTGGKLNILNGKMGISAPHKSVPVAKLVRNHKPKSASELELLIADHVGGGCSCGVVSQGTVADFGKNLYDAQLKFWGEYKYSLKECIQWEYDLFILQMLKGGLMESKCKDILLDLLDDDFDVKDSNSFVDEEIRVDLEIFHKNNLICGVQVKPESFKKVRGEVIMFNQLANEKYDKQVLYVYYNYETEDFSNIDNVVKEINLHKF